VRRSQHVFNSQCKNIEETISEMEVVNNLKQAKMSREEVLNEEVLLTVVRIIEAKLI
jgi:hypothetical protein